MNFRATKQRRNNPAQPIHRALCCSPAIYRRADRRIQDVHRTVGRQSIIIQLFDARPEIHFRATKQLITIHRRIGRPRTH